VVIYHVMDRGDRLEAVFLGGHARKSFWGLRGGVPEDGLGGACVLPDGQSFSPGGGDAAAELGGGDAVVFEATGAEDKARSFANG
jgi:hypothetical protein